MPRERHMTEEEMAASSAAARAALETYCDDLTALAQGGQFTQVSGRDAEIGRIFQILARLRKNNPMLVAGPESGRIAVAMEVVRRIAHAEAPEGVKARQVMALDLKKLVESIGRRGEFEDRFKAVLEGVRLTDHRTILFVDDLHRLVGAGADPDCVDAANVLKPFLARNEGQIFGTSALDEYRIYIERDGALQCRFQEVLLQPSPDPSRSAGSSM